MLSRTIAVDLGDRAIVVKCYVDRHGRVCWSAPILAEDIGPLGAADADTVLRDAGFGKTGRWRTFSNLPVVGVGRADS